MSAPIDDAEGDLGLAARLADVLASGGRRIAFTEDPRTGLPTATLLEADGSARTIALSLVVDPGALAGEVGAPGGPGRGTGMSTPEPDPTRADDPDAWDANLADDEQIPEEDLHDPDLPGAPLEYEAPVDDEVIPGARPAETGDATEGGAGRS